MLQEILLKNIVLDENEKIKDVIRPSLWFYFWPIVSSIILILLAFFLIYPLFRWGRFGIIIFILFIFGGLLIAIRTYFSYLFTAFVMTGKKIIDIDQPGFLDRTVSESLYGKIRDVSYQKKGFRMMALGIGDIYIDFLEGSKKVRIKLSAVKNPQAVVSRINSLHDNYLRGLSRNAISTNSQ